MPVLVTSDSSMLAPGCFTSKILKWTLNSSQRMAMNWRSAYMNTASRLDLPASASRKEV
ncbi:hypothetical protein D3C81_2114030 [compost metagenome]